MTDFTSFLYLQPASTPWRRIYTRHRAVYLACIPDIAELAVADVAAAHAAAGVSAHVAPTSAALERVLEAAWGQ